MPWRHSLQSSFAGIRTDASNVLHLQDVPLNVLFERGWTTYEDADAEQTKVRLLSRQRVHSLT